MSDPATPPPTQAPPSVPESAWTDVPAPARVARPGLMSGWHYAGFWVRFLGFVMDAIVLGMVAGALVPAALPFAGQRAAMTDTQAALLPAATWVALGTLLSTVYFIGFWAWRGKTVGMMPFNMQVVRVSDGKKIGVARGLVRYVVGYISVIPWFLGLIWAAFDSRKQGWHDKIAGTVVIRPD